MSEKYKVETVVMKVDPKMTKQGKAYQRIQTAQDNFWRSNFGEQLAEGDKITCQFEDTPEGYHNMSDLKKLPGKLAIPQDKPKTDFKPASNMKPIPNISELADAAKEMYGKSAQIVSEVLDMEKLGDAQMACVNSVFIFITNQRYPNSKNGR